ncbi:hypothetical protein [Streptomyces sp. NPDC054887]
MARPTAGRSVEPCPRVNVPVGLSLFSIVGGGCLLTWMFAPVAAAAGVLLGLANVLAARKRRVSTRRAYWGLGCSVAACLFWIWLLEFTDWNESGYN